MCKLNCGVRLLGEKNRLVRREQELTVESKQLELADLADRYYIYSTYCMYSRLVINWRYLPSGQVQYIHTGTYVQYVVG